MPNMRKFAATEFAKVDDLRNSREETIAGIVDGKFERPDIIFESGARMSLDGAITLTLCDSFGDSGEDWIGCVVYLVVGTNRNQRVDMVMPIEAPIKKATSKEAKPPDETAF